MTRNARTAMHACARIARDCVERMLSPIERRLVQRASDPLRIIVIVGPARSGTTLLYQCIAARFRVGYVTNLVGRFPNAPVCASLISRLIPRNSSREMFQSAYGKGKGLGGVNQGHSIWTRWFDESNPQSSLSTEQTAQLRGTLRGLQGSRGIPLVIKWPGFSAHMRPLMEAIPEAAMIRVRRNPLHICKSVYKGRIDLTGSATRPISRTPDGYHLQNEPDPIRSVCNYVYSIEHELDSILSEFPRQHYVISYEELCRAPEKTMCGISRWFQSLAGDELQRRGALPESFTLSRGPSLGQTEQTAMQHELIKLGLLDDASDADHPRAPEQDREASA